MNLLYAAQAGDVLVMMDQSGLQYFKFLGEDTDVLGGIVRTSDIVGSTILDDPSPSLEMLRSTSSSERGFYRVGIFRTVNGHVSVPYHNPQIQVRAHTNTIWDQILVQGWYGFLASLACAPLGVVGAAACGAWGGTFLGTVITEYVTGGNAGDDMVFISLVVAPGYFYSADIVVRGGQVFTEGFLYLTPDAFPECTCCPFCP